MTEKLKLKIVRVEEEITPDEISIYKMTLQSKRGTYIKAVAASVWEDERGQRSVTRSWLKDIGKIEAAKEGIESKMKAESKTEEEVKDERKAELKAKMKDIKGTEIEDE